MCGQPLWWPLENTRHLQNITQCIHNLVGVSPSTKQHIHKICCKHVFDHNADLNDKNGKIRLQGHLQVVVHLKVITQNETSVLSVKLSAASEIFYFNSLFIVPIGYYHLIAWNYTKKIITFLCHWMATYHTFLNPILLSLATLSRYLFVINPLIPSSVCP